MTCTRNPQLRTAAREFVKEAISHLRQLGELPRPISAPMEIAGYFWLEQELRGLDSYKALSGHLATSGIAQRLANAGHQWIWHHEVFPWLFVEQFINSAGSGVYDSDLFERLYRRAECEIFSETVVLRRVTVIHGMPLPVGQVRLEKGLMLIHYTIHESNKILSDLLALRFQPRRPHFDIYSNGALLVNDISAPKQDDGRTILRHMDTAALDESLSLLAMRLSCDSFVHPGPQFQVQLSRFPLWPPRRWDPEEPGAILHESRRHLSRAEARRIRLSRMALKRLSDSAPQSHERAPALPQAFKRFDGSFRLIDEASNIVDLMVALEALYLPEPGPELRHRLAMNVANLLGYTDQHRYSIYRQIQLAYDIRNTLVHGRKNLHKDLTDRVKKFLSAIRTRTATVPLERGLGKVARRLRQVVRDSIWAYLNVTRVLNGKPELDRWPDGDKIEEIVFSAKARRNWQNDARISRVHFN